MLFDEFRKSTLRVNNKRHHSIKNSLGVRDAYKWCNANKKFKNKVSEHDFYRIIRTVNNALSDQLIQGNDVKFPQRMGQLEIRKYSTYVKYHEGKIKTNRGIDWQATLKLWYEDQEAKENKILVKVEDQEVFTLYYNKSFANYNNKSIYQFKPHRRLMLAIRKAGKEGNIDAYKIGL